MNKCSVKVSKAELREACKLVGQGVRLAPASVRWRRLEDRGAFQPESAGVPVRRAATRDPGNGGGRRLVPHAMPPTPAADPDLAPPLPPAPDRAEVVVVGAGLAGLAVARGLMLAGRGVVVLEARDDVGGRTRSFAIADGSRLDLGATWFWPGEHRVRALVDEFNLVTHAQYTAGNASYHTPGGVQRLDGNPLDTPSHRLTDGADSLVRALAGTLQSGTIHLANPVVAIEHYGSGDPNPGMVVTHGRGTTSADHVVVAVPPALAVDRIEFTPPLPDEVARLAAVTPVWMGESIKVVAVYDRPFWRDAGLSGSAMSHVGPLREIHDMSGPDGHPAALFGFAPSAAGTVSRQAVVTQLATIFGPEARTADVTVQDWRAEPWTQPQTRTATAEAARTYGHPAYTRAAYGGRLHWSSTETATRAPGHLEGALQAAERTVAAILAA